MEWLRLDRFLIQVNPGGGSGGGGDFEVPTQALPPSGAVDGDMFWCTDDGRLYIYYEDADTSQWVDASHQITHQKQSIVIGRNPAAHYRRLMLLIQ